MNESKSALIQAVRDVRENHVHGVTLITGDRQERFYSYKQIFDNALMYLHTLQAHGIRAGDELVFQLNDDESEHFIFCSGPAYSAESLPYLFRSAAMWNIKTSFLKSGIHSKTPI
ncbi:hypothetical protein PAV_9c01220 [Paenibacillus alvei DSM 29]|uniref:hypothetical protein n=1 Tax=Paenibacillus alvei TaxID=44250 RepID=UPI00028809E2|nr:hypothetical protein [Paenibacillus alvei]EJW15199.1 hypothetical protein PAV_9c01220 [Paenibacillus alvei DSM 29]